MVNENSSSKLDAASRVANARKMAASKQHHTQPQQRNLGSRLSNAELAGAGGVATAEDISLVDAEACVSSLRKGR